MMTTADIRSFFLEYFQNSGHTIVPSSSLVPHNDPTLLFTNAGMVPFKNVFTGDEKRPYSRAASAQKCVRAGGKHNDLDNVGHTARHHTFFEMLGNFSFGDYFKAEAIEFAWNLITKDLGVDKNRLVVTHFSEDIEAGELWKKIAGLPSDKIISIASVSENFWSMGDTGPCGPCSEIFYDHGDHIPGGPPGSPEAEGDRFVEIWNLVFMQFCQVTKDDRVNLPRPSIDTGMGIERIAAVLQGKHDNFDTDIFRAIIEASAHLTHTDPDGPHKVSLRVIADHLRSSCFLMADGVLPSNEGRGYVLRRIMRRAMRHAHMMGVKESLMARLVPTLIEKMGMAYPELIRAQSLITENLNLEEGRFHQTLDKGLKLLSEETAKLGSKAPLPGDVAFKLYDTYGFPLDLTQDVLKSEDRTVDVEGFNAAMTAQKAEARASWSGSGENKDETIWFELNDRLTPTQFLGYESTQADGLVESLIKDNVTIQSAQVGDEIYVITNQTPFYASSGGQVGDTGTLTNTTCTLAVLDTVKKGSGLYVHSCRVESGSLKTGDVLHMRVDAERRTHLMANHSATHLLHTALRERLGDHVTQKGSLVTPDRLRFDFSHIKPMSRQELQDVERAVNDQIRKNAATSVKVMTPDEAIKEGALALFGEKYGDEVRVVSMGEDKFSVELCGGTHVHETGDIGYFKLISESGIAAGIRRIEALTGRMAEDYAFEQSEMVKSLAETLKGSDIENRLNDILNERKSLEKEVRDLRQKLALSGPSARENESQMIGRIAFVTKQLDGISPRDLKPIVDELKASITSGVVMVAASTEGKASLVIGVTEDLMSTLSAVDLIREATPHVGGQGGGGRPDMAQAGGSNPDGIQAAMEAVGRSISNRG